MIGVDRLRNKLREVGYTYNDTTDRTTVWRKGTHRAYVPRRDFIAEDAARAILAQCGVSQADVNEFIRLAKS